MPTYEYRCSACGHELEAFHSMSADPLRLCPACETENLQRLISKGAGMIFKGSGFYQTDYKKSAEPKKEDSSEANKPAAKPAESSQPAGSEAESATPGEAKPAATQGAAAAPSAEV